MLERKRCGNRGVKGEVAVEGEGSSVDEKIAHLQMVQGIISRMAGNSFLTKGWSVTLVAALFALAAADTKPDFVYLAYFPAASFWSLDAFFLWQERLFRKLYDHVRALPAEKVDFSMDTSPFRDKVAQPVAVAFSVTLLLFHGTVVAAILVVMSVLRSLS